MKKTRLILSYFAVIVFIVVQYGFNLSSKTIGGKLHIHFNHMVGNMLLKLDSVHYKNDLSQDYTISKFKYYVGEIRLKNSKGKDYFSKNYFLINEEEEFSKQLVLSNIPYGTYTAIKFTLGVDSIHNCSGAQSGALDPINAMFWAWNTGYIFLKLEGNSTSSKSPSGIVEYHIGGYRQPANCIRYVEFDLIKNPLIINSKTSLIEFKTDASELLKTPTSINFELMPVVTDSKNAELIANNYSDMFSILTVKYEN